MNTPLPHWIAVDWDSLDGLTVHPYTLTDDDREDGMLARGPFVVEQTEVGDGRAVDWLPTLATNLTAISDPRFDRRIIRFDTTTKDHPWEVSKRLTWEDGTLRVPTTEYGVITIRPLKPSDWKLFDNPYLKKQDLSPTEIAKLYWGDADASKYVDSSKVPQQLTTYAEMWEQRNK